MRKYIFVMFVILAYVSSYGQQSSQTCDSQEEDLLDLSSIAKCTVETSKKTEDKGMRQISVKISAPKRRFFKKRTLQKQAGNNINSEGIAKADSENEITKNLVLKSNILNITNRLSKEQIMKADRFNTVESLPLFVNCKSVKKDNQMDCFNSEMIKHIQENLVYPNEAFVNKIQGNVWIRFVIDEYGNISNMKTLGPKNGQVLNDEAMRVISLLPKFIPATKKGKNVPVKYGFPIAFFLEEK